MLRVAQVITRFIAGAGGVALRGALALDTERYSVTVLSAPGGPLLGEAEAAGIEVVRLRHLRPEINPLEDYRALRELMYELRLRKFDIVHTHSSKAGALGRIAADRVGVPGIVHTFHGFPFHNFQAWPMRTGYVQIERRLGRITDRFLGIGGAVAAEAIRLKIAPAERTRAIASAINADVPRRTAASRAAARTRLGLADDAVVVGTVGRLAPQKAPQDMLAAFEALGRRDVKFLWIGDGPLMPEMRRMVAVRGLADRFQLLGERRDVLDLLPALDVFALASRYEGLPCSLVEALTCGIPSVATAVNAVPEVVIPGRTGLLVPPGEPVLLAKAIAYLLNHTGEAERMADAARREIGDRFHPAVLGRDLEETYELALGDSSSALPRRLSVVAHA
jgi:glycosyltransferase involved in cell wall biosynthesis